MDSRKLGRDSNQRSGMDLVHVDGCFIRIHFTLINHIHRIISMNGTLLGRVRHQQYNPSGSIVGLSWITTRLTLQSRDQAFCHRYG